MGRFFANINWITFILLVCIGLLGLFVLLTIDSSYFIAQLIFLLIGLILALFLSHMDLLVLKWMAPVFYIASVLLIVASYFFPLVRGAHRWIFLGDLQLQPSELIKPFLIVSLAHYMAEYSPRHAKYILLHGGLFFIPFVLVLSQPDLGTAIVYGAVWLGMMIAAGFPIRYFFLIAGLLGGLSPFLWQHLAQYQKNRIVSYLNPAIEPQGIGYNAIQAIIAVGSGQLFGRGLGRGTQSHLRFLPEFHTDFIFATLIEEFGFFGGLLLLILYFFLLWRILAPLFRNPETERLCFIYSLGVFCMILSQVFVNTGMNMGIIPVTGITLPFVSYGGSSLLSLTLSFGLLWALQAARTQS